MASTNKKYAYLLFLLSPFISLLNAILSYRTDYFKNILWLFSGYYGYNFVVKGDYDSVRYINQFKEMYQDDVTLWALIKNTYFSVTGRADILEPSVTWFVSRFTEDPKWLFLAFGLIFGYFYSRNVDIILRLTSKHRLSIYFIILFFAFALVIPIHEMNVFRWMTAAQVFFYGAANYYLLDKKKKGSIYVLLTILIHFSFFSAIILFFIAPYILKYRRIILMLFVSSFLITNMDIGWIRSMIESLPGFAQDNYAIYVSEGYLENRQNLRTPVELSFHAKYHNLAIRIVLIAMVLFINYYNRLIRNDTFKVFFYFGLFFYSIYNILDVVPSVHRFTNLGLMFLLGGCFLNLLYIRIKGTKIKRLLMLLSPFTLLYVFVRFRLELEFMNIMTLIGNPITALHYKGATPIIQFIKDFFL